MHVPPSHTVRITLWRFCRSRTPLTVNDCNRPFGTVRAAPHMLQDGTMRGGGSIYYHVGSYTCSGGKWKGELTTREHEPGLITTLFARKVVTMGFTGTYTDDGAEFEATALVGKRSVRLKVIFRLLIAD
jgi:hypothetical protein